MAHVESPEYPTTAPRVRSEASLPTTQFRESLEDMLVLDYYTDNPYQRYTPSWNPNVAGVSGTDLPLRPGRRASVDSDEDGLEYNKKSQLGSGPQSHRFNGPFIRRKPVLPGPPGSAAAVSNTGYGLLNALPGEFDTSPWLHISPALHWKASLI